MKPHKHAELIKAWADGAEIEYWSEFKQMWKDEWKPVWNESTQYRIKPTPKPDYFVDVCVKHCKPTNETYIDHLAWHMQNVRFTFNGETGKLKSVEMI